MQFSTEVLSRSKSLADKHLASSSNHLRDSQQTSSKCKSSILHGNNLTKGQKYCLHDDQQYRDNLIRELRTTCLSAAQLLKEAQGPEENADSSMKADVNSRSDGPTDKEKGEDPLYAAWEAGITHLLVRAGAHAADESPPKDDCRGNSGGARAVGSAPAVLPCSASKPQQVTASGSRRMTRVGVQERERQHRESKRGKLR